MRPGFRSCAAAAPPPSHHLRTAGAPRACRGTSQTAENAHGGHSAQIGEVHFPTSCSAAVQPEFDQCGRHAALVHVRARPPKSFTRVTQLDSTVRLWANWGIAMTWLWGNPFAPAARIVGPLGAAAAETGVPPWSADPRGSATTSRRSRRSTGTGRRPPTSPARWLMSRPWSTSTPRIQTIRRRPSLRAGVNITATTDGQDLRQRPPGGRDSRGAVRRSAAAPRHCPLPDPQLRLPAAGPAGVGCRAALRGHCAGGAARPAYAFAHLHASRRLARVGGLQPSRAGGRPPGAGGARRMLRWRRACTRRTT